MKKIVPVILAVLMSVAVISASSTAATSYGLSGTTSGIFSSGTHSSSFDLISALYHYFGIGGTSTSFKERIGFICSAFSSLNLSVSSITPSTGYNTGTINITKIEGTDFNGSTVKLTKSGESDINGTEVTVVSVSKIICNFDLTGKATGIWDLVVTNSDGQSATLANAFTMKSWVTIGNLMNYPNPFDPTKEQTRIVYPLVSNADTMVLIFNISRELVWKRNFSSGASGGKAGDNSVVWDGINDFGEIAGNGIYFCRVIDRTTGNVLAKGKIAVSR